jgi:Protein of unknown function (DUF3891)
MIVRPFDGSLLLITQPDHAALAGRIMEQWTAGGLQDSPRRDDIFVAIYQHDNGWREPDAAPIVDREGKILDFVHAPDDVRHALWVRGIERLAETPYAAALVAQHAIHVYDRKRADPAWTAFFDDMEAARARHLGRTSASREELWSDYAFLRLADLISLTFCNGWRDQAQDHGGFSVRGDTEGVLVTPDPFGSARIRMHVTAVLIPNAPFPSSAEVLKAIERGEQQTLTGVVRGWRSSSCS